MLIDGTTVYKSWLTRTEIYKDKQGRETDTEKFSIQLLIDKKDAAKLAKDGMILKDHEGTPMRKFKSKYAVEVYNSDRTRWTEEIPSGSEVRVEYTTVDNSQYGAIPYVNRIVIKKLGENVDGAIFDGIEGDEPPFQILGDMSSPC